MAEAGEMPLKDKGNEFFKAGNYLKAAALYTQAIKQDPSNPTLYSNRAAAFLQLVKVSKALADAEMTISLNPQWEKGYFRKGCILEAMERYDGLKCLPDSFAIQSTECTSNKKDQEDFPVGKDKQQAKECENTRSNVDMEKHLDAWKSEKSEKYRSEGYYKDAFSFLVETMETTVKSWHETSKVDARVYFLLDKEKTDTEKYAPVVNIDKLDTSALTGSSWVSHSPKPMVWKGQGSRKWKHGQHDGFFVQFESPHVRKLWFIPSSNEKGQVFCRLGDPVLGISVHEVLPRIFKEKLPSS